MVATLTLNPIIEQRNMDRYLVIMIYRIDRQKQGKSGSPPTKQHAARYEEQLECVQGSAGDIRFKADKVMETA